jgi:hypothetical protein
MSIDSLELETYLMIRSIGGNSRRLLTKTFKQPLNSLLTKPKTFKQPVCFGSGQIFPEIGKIL